MYEDQGRLQIPIIAFLLQSHSQALSFFEVSLGGKSLIKCNLAVGHAQGESANKVCFAFLVLSGISHKPRQATATNSVASGDTLSYGS